MLLYHDLRAPNPRRVRMFLAEKGVAYDTIEVSIAAQAHQSDAFRAKNPLALLPVLELDDGRVLRESMAICRYVEEAVQPEPNLFGVEPWERAQIEMWNRHAELELLWPISQVFRNSHEFWKGRLKQSPEFAEIMRELLVDRFEFFDHSLATRPYVAGERFSVADITALCALDFGRVSKLRIDPTKHASLAAWHARVSERPSAKA
ncbi:MAG: glutathione S-transferase family protein [Proteobacteria bacterium]|nr:glutathione S-transferase family protein [Pseudomonadota bacterium]